MALLALSARVIQLALAPAADTVNALAAPNVAAGSVARPAANNAAANAELAELYTRCPLAAVVDLKTVTDSPEKIDAILPPYHLTSDRVPNAPHPAVVPT